MTCIVCGESVSWSRMDKIVEHVHLVLENDLPGQEPPCGIALNADVENAAAVFLCLRHASSVGRAATKALKAIGASA